MKILIGSQRHDALAKARDWFACRRNYEVLEEIISWATGNEHRWGEGILFVETDIPGLDRQKARNVDLVVAFSDRVAVCEVKGHRNRGSAQGVLFKSLAQCCESYDLIQQHLARRRIVPTNAVKPFVFMPNLGNADIAALTAVQLSRNSLRHVTLAGGADCRTKPVLDNGQPLYLPIALHSRIEPISFERNSYAGNAQKRLSELIQSDGVIEFHTLDRAVVYLNTEADVAPDVRLPVGHVRGLCKDELERTEQILAEHGVVETTGAFGVGKSSLIREFLNNAANASPQQLRIAAVDLSRIRDTRQLCRELLRHFDVPYNTLYDEQQLLARVIATDCYIWIQSYDGLSASIIQRFCNALTASTRRCRVLIESIKPLLPETYRTNVLLLRPRAMRAILSASRPGAHGRPLGHFEGIGNPRLALSSWIADDQSKADDDVASQLGWIEQVFKGFKRDVVNFVGCLFGDAPLGANRGAITGIAAKVFGGRPYQEVENTLAEVLGVLARADLADSVGFVGRDCIRLYQLSGESQGQLDTQVFYTVTVHSSLIAYVKAHLSADECALLESRITKAIDERLNTRGGFPWAVISGFRHNTLVPYCSSTNRRGDQQDEKVIHWLNRRAPQRLGLPESEHYLERFIRFTYSAGVEKSIQITPTTIERNVGLPPLDEPLHLHVWKVLNIVAESLSGSDINLDAWTASYEGPYKIAAVEALCWLYTLQPRKQLWPYFSRVLKEKSTWWDDGDDTKRRLSFQAWMLLNKQAAICLSLSGPLWRSRRLMVEICFTLVHSGIRTVDRYYAWCGQLFFGALDLLISNYRRKELERASERLADDGNPIQGMCDHAGELTIEWSGD